MRNRVAAPASSAHRHDAARTNCRWVAAAIVVLGGCKSVDEVAAVHPEKVPAAATSDGDARESVAQLIEDMKRDRLQRIPGAGRKSLSPPLPELEMGEFFWEGAVTLESFRGFVNASGPYGSARSGTSQGTAKLSIKTSGEPADAPGPCAAQIEAFRQLRTNEAAVASAVLDAILHEPSAARGATTRAELEQKIGLSELHVLPIEKDGVAFIGFEFGTVPSTEDGLGVLTHRGRVVLVGTADVSFVEWMAKKAGGRPSF